MSEVGKERLKRIASLATAKGRTSEDALLVEGPRLVREALASGHARELLVRDAAEAARWRELAPDRPVRTVGAAALSRLASVRTPQPVVAVARRLDFDGAAALFARGRRLLFLDGVQDPGNVGTLVRTARALGIEGVLIGPGTADPEGPKVLRASAGALFRTPLARLERREELADLASARGVHLVLPVVRGGRSALEMAAPLPFVLVAGNEGRGSEELPGDAVRVTIPMAVGSESLNVGAAIAVLLGRWWDGGSADA